MTFRNTSTDDCGLAAVYDVGLTSASGVGHVILTEVIYDRIKQG
ncbi:hypothetical protein ACFLW6_02460 [Chloroflexota bacterium]